MKRNSQASFRLSPDLKAEIREIAKEERRTLSNAIEMLLRSAVRNYRRRKVPRTPEHSDEPLLPSDEAIARRVADIIVAGGLLGKGSGRLREQTPNFRRGDGEKKKQRA